MIKMKCQCNKSNIMISAEQRRLELFVVTVFLYLVPIMIMQTVRLKIQQLILSASSASHMAVTAFYHTIILMITTVILPRLSKTVSLQTSMFMTALTSLKKNTTM